MGGKGKWEDKKGMKMERKGSKWKEYENKTK